MGMQLTGKGSLVASSLTAIGASVCCVGPLVLLALGVGGTWVGALTMMEPLRPLFIGLTLLFLGLAFRKLYLVPQVCTQVHPAPIRARSCDSDSCSGSSACCCSAYWPCRGSPRCSTEGD